MEDDFFSRNEMVKEVMTRAVWRDRHSDTQVRLEHYFRDEENRKMDVVFAPVNSQAMQALCYKEFQKRYVKV
jgi:hypothetical protein